MPHISMMVKDKIVTKTDLEEYVCGNSDFVAKFDFDAEWDTYSTKTARFVPHSVGVHSGNYIDVVFSGTECAIPIIDDADYLDIGVFAGNLHATTPARVPCKKSILSDTGYPADPPDDVYNQIMAKLNSSDANVTAANIAAALGYTPVAPGLGVSGATAGKLLKIIAVDENGAPTKFGTGAAVSAIAPTFAANVSAMTDTNKVYIGANGHLWAYQQSTEQQTTAENVFSKSGVQLNVRLKTNGAATSAQNGMAISDFIPVSLSTDPFWVWFKGWNLKASEAWALYTKVYYYDADKACLGGYDMSIPPATLNYVNMIDDGAYKKFKAGYAETTQMDASTEAKLSFYSSIKYIRFNMLVVPGSSTPATATEADLDGIEIYLNQNPNETSEVVKNAWADTGITYAQAALTQADKEAIAEIVLEQLGNPYVTQANVLKMPESGTVVYADTSGTLADTEPIGEV